MTLWFGKFKGHMLQDIPDDYLFWLVSQNLRNEKLRAAVDEERERRLFMQEHPGSVNPRLVDEIVSAGVRSLTRKYHPDVGDATDRKQTINADKDWSKLRVFEALPC